MSDERLCAKTGVTFNCVKTVYLWRFLFKEATEVDSVSYIFMRRTLDSLFFKRTLRSVTSLKVMYSGQVADMMNTGACFMVVQIRRYVKVYRWPYDGNMG